MSNPDLKNEDLMSEERKRALIIERNRKIQRVKDNMIHYPIFVDKKTRKGTVENISKWDWNLFVDFLTRIKPIRLRMPETDYDNNILFICNENIMKEVFFIAFWKLPELVDFRWIELLLIQELWYGRVKKKDYYEDEMEAAYSFNDIKQDVLCTYVSSNMAEVGIIPEIMTTVISSRSEKLGRKTEGQNTWIYYEGTIEELRNSKFQLWESFFKRNGVIIDLNPESKQNDSNEQTEQDAYSLF